MRDRFLKKIVLAAVFAVIFLPAMIDGLAWLTHKNINLMTIDPAAKIATAGPILDARHEQHILYGDGNGGGHLYGMGKACKSEFPSNWRAEDIVAHVIADAANDNLDWRRAQNGYDVAEVMDNGVEIRLVVDRQRNLIITAYPLNTPRHDCPRLHGGAANDNGDAN